MCKECEDETSCCLCLGSDSEDDHQDVRLEQLRRALHHFYPPDGDSEEQSDGGPDDDDSEEQSDGDPDDDDSEEQGSDGYS